MLEGAGLFHVPSLDMIRVRRCVLPGCGAGVPGEVHGVSGTSPGPLSFALKSDQMGGVGEHFQHVSLATCTVSHFQNVWFRKC